jgi:assimilatory nitrate reductase catalytic subunit
MAAARAALQALRKEFGTLRATSGALTSELVREPGKFGLGQVPSRLAPNATTTAVCGFCSTGCGLTIHLRDGEALNLGPDSEYPVNMGMACPKGWEALAPLQAADRGTTPLMRERAGGPLRPVTWDRALDRFCAEFKAIQQRHGNGSVAFLSTGQITTEEMAFLGCLFKFGMGFVNCDSNTRQCMATAHVAYKESFGFDAPPYTYADFEESDVLVFVGSNPCIAHPILWQRVTRNRNRPEIIVVDPRATETAMAATQHYPIRPKSDLVLLYGLANLLISMGAVKADFVREHTSGFEAFAAFAAPFSPGVTSLATGVSEDGLRRLAQTIADGRRVSFWWTMGVNQGHESTRTAQAIINLALMTGNIGRPGTGANSITGQCNAMGSRLFANITSLIGGHDANDPADREKVAAVLGIPEAVIPRQPSLAYDQILERIDAGEIKGLWVVATNSLHSWGDQMAVRATLAKLDFLVVQDMYPTTDTAKMAHLYLPAAGWGEKDGTLINSERRIGLVKKVRRAPGVALSDFNILRLIAQRWGCSEMFRGWTDPEAAFGLLRDLSRGQPCDVSAIRDYRMIDGCGGIQWPCREVDLASGCSSPVQERRLFADGRFYTSDQRARFVFETPRAMPEAPDADYPTLMMSGRGTSSQWHTNTRTGKSGILRRLYPKSCYVEMNPSDAGELGVSNGSPVVVRSRRGQITAFAFVTPTIQRAHAFIPMHYPEANLLTRPVVDSYSRQPSYKVCAVRISAAPKGARPRAD